VSLHASAVETLSAWAAPDDAQDRLRHDYLRHLADNEDGVWRECAPAHLTASSLIVDPAAERVLLLLHGKVKLWLQSGGHCEAEDGSLADTALREATEESGIEGLVLSDGPVLLDRHGAPCNPGVVEHHLDVKYVAIAPEGAQPRISDESLDARWFRYDDLPELTPPDVHVFVDVAVRSLHRQPADRQRG
jgi:8-oxo-dGTP pyrophosphatase MutT (NUDIX family)